MPKLYAITEGYYSDYSITALVSDKEKALALYASLIRKGGSYFDYHFEEYEDGVADEVNFYSPYYVVFLPNGSTEMTEKADESNANLAAGAENAVTFLGVGRVAIWVLAKDEEGAKKIAAEKRAMFLAQKNGL